MNARSTLASGDEKFTVDDLHAVSELVAATWTAAAQLDWSATAGTVEWSCLATADHAVDCAYAPAIFLASRKLDGYPEVGLDPTMGIDATPARLVQSLEIATRLLAAVVNDAEPDVHAVIFRRPDLIIGAPEDFAPRGAMELILHAHDVCQGLQVPFDPPRDICHRLREHTYPWPMWTVAWRGLTRTDDPWHDLLEASGRRRSPS